MTNIISEAATRKLSRLKQPYAAMSPEEQLAFTQALRARRRAPERPLKATTIARRGKSNAKVDKALEILVEWNTAQAAEAQEAPQ